MGVKEDSVGCFKVVHQETLEYGIGMLEGVGETWALSLTLPSLGATGGDGGYLIILLPGQG